MRLQVAIVLLLAAHLSFTLAEPVSGVEEVLTRKAKCARLYPPTYGSCTYMCKVWPFRSENEPDGTPCGEFPNGVCVNGRCVDGDISRSSGTVTPPATTPTSSYDHQSPKTEVRSTRHKRSTASRQTTSQPIFTTTRSDQKSSSSSSQIMYSARTTTPNYQLSRSGGSTVSKKTASSMNNKSTQPFSSTTRIAEITTNRNQQTASENTSTSPRLRPLEQHASTRLRYDGKHTEKPTRTEHSSRGRSSTSSRHPTTLPMPAVTASRAAHVTEKPTQEERSSATRSTFSEHVTTPTVPAEKALSTIPANASPNALRNETPGVTVTGSQPTDNSTRTSTPPTTDTEFTSMREGRTSGSPDRNPAASEISHEHVSDHRLTTIGSDLGSDVWSTRVASAEISAGPGATYSPKIDVVTEATVGSNEIAENGSTPTAATSGTTPPAQSVARLETRDPSSFELSIEINVKGRLPFLKH